MPFGGSSRFDVDAWCRSGDGDIRLTDRCNPSTALRQGQSSGA
nr:MAG TPA: hypothetical protein [Caudoviricetes sp.]